MLCYLYFNLSYITCLFNTVFSWVYRLPCTLKHVSHIFSAPIFQPGNCWHGQHVTSDHTREDDQPWPPVPCLIWSWPLPCTHCCHVGPGWWGPTGHTSDLPVSPVFTILVLAWRHRHGDTGGGVVTTNILSAELLDSHSVSEKLFPKQRVVSNHLTWS